jgi:hypothetical protein
MSEEKLDHVCYLEILKWWQGQVEDESYGEKD